MIGHSNTAAHGAKHIDGVISYYSNRCISMTDVLLLIDFTHALQFYTHFHSAYSPLSVSHTITHPRRIVSAIKTCHLNKCFFRCSSFFFEILKMPFHSCNHSYMCAHSVNTYALDYAVFIVTEGKNYT